MAEVLELYDMRIVMLAKREINISMNTRRSMFVIGATFRGGFIISRAHLGEHYDGISGNF